MDIDYKRGSIYIQLGRWEFQKLHSNVKYIYLTHPWRRVDEERPPRGGVGRAEPLLELALPRGRRGGRSRVEALPLLGHLRRSGDSAKVLIGVGAATVAAAPGAAAARPRRRRLLLPAAALKVGRELLKAGRLDSIRGQIHWGRSHQRALERYRRGGDVVSNR